MPIDHHRVQAWLDAYVRAWETYDHDGIVALFADDAEYRWHPWDQGTDVARGPEEIAAGWVEPAARDEEGTYEGRYEPVAVDGDVAVARGISRYYIDASRSTLDKEYHNVFLMRFADDGRCRSFTELYMQTPKR
jgi:ketosteroid isomerase-like protein